MSQTSERNHAHSYRSVHGSALDNPRFDLRCGDKRCVDAEVGNCPKVFLSIMKLSVGDNLSVWFPIVQTKMTFERRSHLPYILSKKKNKGANNNATATTYPNPQASSSKTALFRSFSKREPGSNAWWSKLRFMIIRIEPHTRAVVSQVILGFKQSV